MPFDHYVSQVHLKNFYSPSLGNQMYAIRKRDLKAFKPNAKSICRIEEGSTNEYLRHDRAIEDFLKDIEPKYNSALLKLETEKIDTECIYTIAGFVAFVLVCSPAGMRIMSDPLKGMGETTAKMLDSQGKLPEPPPELEETSLTGLLDNRKLSISIDPKYPQAIGISQILFLTSIFGNFRWEILHNEIKDRPFFTSDYPIAIEETEDPRILNKIVPLSPKLSIRICPDPSFEKEVDDFTFSRFTYRSLTPNRKEVAKINKLVVRSAESIVLYRDNHNWVQRFVAKNSTFRIEPYTKKIKINNGTLLLSTQRIAEFDKASNL